MATENPLIAHDHVASAMTLGSGAGGRQQQQHLLHQPQQQQHGRSTSLGLTALMSSCQLNNELEVKALLQRKPSLTTARDRSGKTALHYCAENLTVGCAELLLLCEPGLTSVQDEEGYTTLHFAVISGNRTMVRFLVERGADVNCVDNEKHSCVHWATVCGELECMDILVSAGANPSTADIHGAYPIHYAAQMCGPNSEMGNDVRVGLAALRRLIELGVDVSVRDQDGRPPLPWAASVETRPSKTYCPSGSSDAILALVNAGADVSATDKDGLTALHCAASRGHVDCLETLVSLCGADVDAVDSNGCSALFYAVTLGHADCTQLLLKYGAAANRQDHKGRTPAHCGAAKGQMETLKILWQHGANLYMRNQRGDLPLHEAVQSGRKDLVQWLLGLQPSAVNSPNNNGRCALHVAAMANSVEMCKVLMDGGAEVNPVMRNSKGQLLTPLDASLQRGNRGCAKYLRLHGALPFCKMTDRHDIDRWLEHSFNINKLHQTEQLCDAEAPMVGGGGSAEHLQVVDSRNVQTLETSVQTDSGYFESREYAASKGGHQGGIEAVTKQGTFIEGGRTLKQAIITNVYVRTSGAARVHQPKRKRKQGDASKEKGHSMTEGSEETEEYSSCEERKVELRDTSNQKGSSHKEHGVLKEAKKHVALESSSERRVTEEVIVKKRDGVEGHIVKRITRRPAEGDGGGVDDVRVSGEIRDNIETTPEGFTSVTFSEQKSSEAGRASSEEDPRTKLVAQESASTRMLGDVPERASKQPLMSPAVIKSAERFLSLLSKRRSRVQEAKTSGEQISAEARVTAKVEKTAAQKDTETVTSNLEDEPQLDKKSRSLKDKAKHALKEGRRSPARRSSSSGQSSSGRDSAVTSKKEKVLKSKGSTRSISQEVSKERRRKSGPVTGQKDELELTARRTSKTSKHSVPGAESTSEPDQSSSGQSSPLKQSKQKAGERRDTKTRLKGDVSTKKSTVRPTKEPERRMSTRREDASSTMEGSDSRGVDETTQEPLKQRDSKLAPDAQEASGGLRKEKRVSLDERLLSGKKAQMHREYEEIESHATIAEFFSETSMSDSALEQRSDRLLLKREGATGEHEMQEGTTVLEKPKKGTKHKPPEKAQVPKGEPEPKSTHKVGGNGRASGKSGEKRKELAARKESRRISDASPEEESDGEPVEISGDTRARKRKPVVAETSEETNVSERRRRHSKVEERVVRRVSSSESIAESRSEVTETDEDSVVKKTTEDKGRTSKKQPTSNIIADSSPGKPKLSGKKPKKPKKSTSRDSSQEDHDDDHAKAESEMITTEVCEEEEIIERHATESIVEVLETKISDELCKDLSIDTDGPSKGTKGRIKDETVLPEHRKDGRSKDKRKPKSGRTTSGRGSPDRHESGGSFHSASSVEVFKEAESSEEITSFTKEASSMQRSSELVTSEETVQKSSREEIVQHTSEISVKGGESAGAPESPPSARLGKAPHEEKDKTMEKQKLSSNVAEAVVELYNRIQRSPSGDKTPSELQRQPPSEDVPDQAKDREEIDTASQERHKDTTEEEKQTHSEHEEHLSASRIPPLVADAVSDLFSQVKQSTTASTSPYEKARPMRDAASSPVLGPTTVEIACGSDDAYLMDAGCNPRQYSIEVSEKGNSPGENAYTAEAACSTVAEETKSAACSPAINKVDASCSPLESVDQPPMQDETCSPITTDIGKPREKVDASCSPILELAEELAETKEAACSPVVTSVPAEKTDTASSPAEITKTADAQSSPIAVSIDQKDSSSSPILKMFQQDEESSPIAVEVEDKETCTSPQEETTLDSSCTPLWSTEMLERAKAAAIEKADTASSPVGVQPTRDEECSPIVTDLGGDTRDVACSPIDISLDERPEKRDLVSAAISPIPSQLSDKATSPPETATTVHAGVSPFPPTPGVEKGSSPHVAATRDASCSPFEDQFQASGKLGTAATAEKPATADVCSETSPEEQKPAMKADVADAACSPVAFEFSRLSRSSSGSTEVDIAVRSSSLEEVTKTPTTDIAAIPSLRETGTSIRVGTKEGVVGDSTSALGMSTIVDTGTSPFAPLAQARGTSTEGKAAQLALSDTGTSPLESTTTAKGTNTRDAANSPIETAPAAGRKTLKDVIRLKKPLPLRKTRSWDTMGYGGVDETRPKEFLFPDIRLPSRIEQLIATTPGSTSPGQHGASPDKLSAEDARQLQKLPSIIKTASTPPDTAVVTGGSPGGTMDVRELKKPSLQPIGVKRHSLTQSDYDRSPESSVRSSDLTANTLKDSGFSDVEKHVSGGSSAEEEDRSDRQGVFSDSAAHELEIQRRKLLSRRKMREGDDDVSPGREDTDGSAVEDDATAGRTRERLPDADKRGGPSGDSDVKMNGRREGVKGQRRRRGQPELQPVTESRKPPEDITMAVQESLRKYRVERQLFSELQELKRHQIRSGRTHENVLVKRLVDRFRELVLAPGMRDFAGPYTFRNYERYLYGQLRDLSTSNDGKIPAKYRKKSDDYEDSGAVSDGPLECVSRAYGLGRAADDCAAEAETGADAVKAGEHSGPQGGMAVDAAERRSREAEALEPMASQSSRSGPPLQPVGRKNLLPAILPSPLTSVFTVVRGAPPLPAARTGYGHVRSRVFPQQPSQKVQLTESDRSPRKTPPAPVRAKKEAATNTTEVASNQASRLRLERIRKQREEEDRLRKIRAEKASKVATEVTSRSHGSVQNLRRISEEESLERAAATDGALSEQESEHVMKKKQRSTSLTREAMRRTKGDAQAEKSPAKEPRKPVAARASDGSKKPATSGRQPARLHEAPQATADTNKPVFPYLKKREGRLSVSRAEESRDSRVSVVTKSRDADRQERMTTSHSTSRRPAASPEPLETMAGKRPAEPTTPRRPFSKAKETTATTPKQSSALLPFWVPHDPNRTEAVKALQEKHHRSKVRESLGEQQAVRFKDWIKARQQSSATSVERASIAAADAATEALAREVRLREGDSSETDSGHEGDGILPDDQKVKEVLLEKVSRSLKKNVLPQDVVTMRLKPSPPAAVDDQIEAITRTVRMSEFLEAARRDIVVNCVQLRPDNVSEGSASPEGVPSPAASSGGGGSVSDGAAVEDDDGVLEFEIRHGREKNVFWLPTSKIRDNKKWQVTFIVARADQE